MANQDTVKTIQAVIKAAQKILERKQEKEAEEAAIKEQQEQATPVDNAVPSNVFLTWDLDNAGNSVARAERTDDVEKVKQVSASIDAAQKAATNWVLTNSGTIVEIGGDEGMAEISNALMPELEAFRKEILKASGFTVTVGVGDKISRAIDSRELGKLRGKDQVVVWDENVPRELELRLQQQEQEDEVSKVKNALEEPVKKSEQENEGQDLGRQHVGKLRERPLDLQMEPGMHGRLSPVGITRSGKRIHREFEHPEHKDFSAEDHFDAAYLHEHRQHQLGVYGNRFGGLESMGNEHRLQSQKHLEVATKLNPDIGNRPLHSLDWKSLKKSEGPQSDIDLAHTPASEPQVVSIDTPQEESNPKSLKKWQ